MVLLSNSLALVSAVNDRVLRFGRGIGCVAMVLMVFAILLQVFYRYVLNNALPWPEEAARAFMIWMMAVVAPSAYRAAGFVSIDMFPGLLPEKIRSVLMFMILLLCTLVIVIMLQHAWAHYCAPLLFDSSGLNRLLQESGINRLLGTNLRFKTAYIYLAMSVLSIVMLSVSVELFLRQIGRFLGLAKDLPPSGRDHGTEET
ncbi:MAG: TRAP transporter small permease subunit [Gammaproteobacteria bacterium]|nr:TRAP transporter small permease subunit [Gammaproteobacteria bacterium]